MGMNVLVIGELISPVIRPKHNIDIAGAITDRMYKRGEKSLIGTTEAPFEYFNYGDTLIPKCSVLFFPPPPRTLFGMYSIIRSLGNIELKEHYPSNLKLQQMICKSSKLYSSGEYKNMLSKYHTLLSNYALFLCRVQDVEYLQFLLSDIGNIGNERRKGFGAIKVWSFYKVTDAENEKNKLFGILLNDLNNKVILRNIPIDFVQSARTENPNICIGRYKLPLYEGDLELCGMPDDLWIPDKVSKLIPNGQTIGFEVS